MSAEGEAGAPEDVHWFQAIARFLGPAYLRYSFTKGTEQEVSFLVGALGLERGDRVLDAGCGPGRHSLALARRGIDVVGVDLSAEFIELARAAAAEEALPARFEVDDVRTLAFDREFDAVICLCQGGFGLLGGVGDEEAFGRIVRSVRPGGRLATSAFSLVFMVRHLEEGETLDVAAGVLHEHTTLRDLDGEERPAEAWTTGFTVRELRLLAAAHGLSVDAVHGVTPGRYRASEPTLDDPELLLLARRADGGGS